jgi:hypothetical protein
MLNNEPEGRTREDEAYVYAYQCRQSTVRSGSMSQVPGLARSDSYSSYSSYAGEPISPMTPSLAYTEYHLPSSHDYPSKGGYWPEVEPEERSSRPRSKRTESYASSDGGVGGRKPEKRFACKFSKQYNCNQTFTTSGHASRHAKIHQGDKTVRCTEPGCEKRFTRTDNMKQHLETHNKDKSKSKAARHAKAKKSASHSERSRPKMLILAAEVEGATTYAQYHSSDETSRDSTPLPSPAGYQGDSYNTYSGAGYSLARRPAPGLDILSQACQQDRS